MYPYGTLAIVAPMRALDVINNTTSFGLNLLCFGAGLSWTARAGYLVILLVLTSRLGRMLSVMNSA